MGIVLGIDESGRGSVLGPLVMYGVVTNSKSNAYLLDLGIDDSKKLTAEKRATLSSCIKKRCIYSYSIRDAKIVDQYVEKHSLNQLEVEMAIEIIRDIMSMNTFLEGIMLDGTKIFDPILEMEEFNKRYHIRCEAKADQHYAPVAAASILAKHHRDKLVLDITQDKKINGYPNHTTQRWIENLLTSGVDLKFISEIKHIRTSWNWKGLDKLKQQQTTGEISNEQTKEKANM